jgi:hypothetical protein
MNAGEPQDVPKRTTALALWRYAHDYLRVAKMMCSRHRLRCDESQVPHHVMAQAIEFALKAFLRTRGVTVAQLSTDFGHSLDRALERALRLGLPPLPRPAHAAIEAIAPYHREREFRYVPDEQGFPDLRPLYAAAVHILDAIADDVAADYVSEFGADGSPTAEEFVRRLRADLAATAANGG